MSRIPAERRAAGPRERPWKVAPTPVGHSIAVMCSEVAMSLTWKYVYLARSWSHGAGKDLSSVCSEFRV